MVEALKITGLFFLQHPECICHKTVSGSMYVITLCEKTSRRIKLLGHLVWFLSPYHYHYYLYSVHYKNRKKTLISALSWTMDSIPQLYFETDRYALLFPGKCHLQKYVQYDVCSFNSIRNKKPFQLLPYHSLKCSWTASNLIRLSFMMLWCIFY